MTKDSDNRGYADAWEQFWGTLSGDPADVLWNVPYEQAAATDFARFRDVVTKNGLPLVDVGCGDGTQTPFFAEHTDPVIGVDISAKAIEIARQTAAAPNVTYRVLDLMNTADCAAFHAEVGDANLYMRGVLMQFAPDDRPTAAANLRRLMGETGYLYLNEYVPQTKAYYAELFEEQGLPAGFRRVIESGINPGGIDEDEMRTFFPPEDFEVVRRGKHVMNTIIPLDDGGYAQAPAFYALITRR